MSMDDESVMSESEPDVVPEADNGRPKVLIVGAGLGGLMLGNLLRIAGVRYDIFEYSKDVKPIGTWGAKKTVLWPYFSLFLLPLFACQSLTVLFPFAFFSP